MTKSAICLGAVLLFSSSALSGDWGQYRGPSHDGISSEVVAKWPEAGPKLLWKAPMKAGFGSITVANGIAATLVLRAKEGVEREHVVAFDAITGKELWASALAVAKYDGGGDSGTPENQGGDGPRSTPTIDDGKVYVLDGKLNLLCFDAKTGAPKWSRDLVTEHKANVIRWQNAASPVIEGNLIFVAGGGEAQSLLGIDKNSGKTVWKSESDGITHATPTVVTIHGQQQVIFFTQKGLVSCEPKTGKVLWRHPYNFSVSTAASPIVAGDIVYCSAGYGVGAGAAKITKTGDTWKAEEIWRERGNKLANHWSTPILKGGYLYGMFQFKEYGSGALKCVDVKSGKEVWSQPNFGPGNVTLAGDKLVALSDAGDVVLINPTPEKYSELGRFRAVEGKCWSTPTIANGRIYVRSVKEGACYEVGSRLSLR
ncbi:MAG TPA: PQQ-binding-like beta-propeller repeat protein [Verrucomicrobiae bacterium]|nr:PQQ-binding-like beta-propeller repeat protein [Verrucomicrobiae bacterium]